MTPTDKIGMMELLQLLSKIRVEDKVKFRDYLQWLSPGEEKKEAMVNG